MIIMSKFYKLSDFYSRELLKHQKCLRPGTHPCPVHIYTKNTLHPKDTAHFLYHRSGNYSFRIAARGLNFIALLDGKKPATIPITTANTIAAPASHGGI